LSPIIERATISITDILIVCWCNAKSLKLYREEERSLADHRSLNFEEDWPSNALRRLHEYLARYKLSTKSLCETHILQMKLAWYCPGLGGIECG
jgi:hypothetical protein